MEEILKEIARAIGVAVFVCGATLLLALLV